MVTINKQIFFLLTFILIIYEVSFNFFMEEISISRSNIAIDLSSAALSRAADLLRSICSIKTRLIRACIKCPYILFVHSFPSKFIYSNHYIVANCALNINCLINIQYSFGITFIYVLHTMNSYYYF